jgi:hypothetical protein
MTNDEMVKNVEKMLKREDAVAKAQAKKGAKIISFDLNEGVVGSVPGSKGGESDDLAASTFNKDMAANKRKTMAVKADNVNEVFMDNITAIADSVNNFAQLEEETVQNDPALLFAKEKENYDREIEQL